mmetsp:Transcript_7236/g.15790  ORF Transcript_7236/g.15790 Transcript_7236/m.15790 type:complete len:424 (-) Transcript_7236:117-1388(-)
MKFCTGVQPQAPEEMSKPPPEVDKWLQEHLSGFNFAFTVTDPLQPDNPIVYASTHFCEMTGYPMEEVLGRNCRFLQGPETERRLVMEIRDAIREERSCQVCITNYKKDGTIFLNQFFMAPIRNPSGRLLHYLGIQTDVTNVLSTAREDVLHKIEEGAMDPADADAGVLEDNVEEVVSTEVHEAEEVQEALTDEPVDARSCSSLPCSLIQALHDVQQSYVLADPHLHDMPIVHASPRFLQLTGYSREQVVGRNCRFLQGPGTDPQEVLRLRDAIQAEMPVTVTLLNYNAHGKPFYNALHVAPVRDASGKVVLYVGVQLDITQGSESESGPRPLGLQHKVAHKSVTGAVRVAVRSLGGTGPGLRREAAHQQLPRCGSHDLPSRITSKDFSSEQGPPHHSHSAPPSLLGQQAAPGGTRGNDQEKGE